MYCVRYTEDMQTLQMHGTGTSLGDPIEFGASLAVLKRDSGAPLLLEAVKSFIGHTECASGIIVRTEGGSDAPGAAAVDVHVLHFSGLEKTRLTSVRSEEDLRLRPTSLLSDVD